MHISVTMGVRPVYNTDTRSGTANGEKMSMILGDPRIRGVGRREKSISNIDGSSGYQLYSFRRVNCTDLSYINERERVPPLILNKNNIYFMSRGN